MNQEQQSERLLLSRKQLGGLFLGGIAAATTLPALAQSSTATPVPFTGSDAFDILVADHHRIKHHLELLISDVGSRRDTLLAVSALFTVHNATEENFVYPQSQRSHCYPMMPTRSSINKMAQKPSYGHCTISV